MVRLTADVIYSSAPVTIGDRTYFYYMGGNGQHTNFRETNVLSRNLRWERYFAYWDKRPEHPGVLYTKWIYLPKWSEVYLDAEIEDGFINVELLEKQPPPKVLRL